MWSEIKWGGDEKQLYHNYHIIIAIILLLLYHNYAGLEINLIKCCYNLLVISSLTILPSSFFIAII